MDEGLQNDLINLLDVLVEKCILIINKLIWQGNLKEAKDYLTDKK
jgi:hypothetical protein